jgi:hypothetical protein
MRQRSDLRRAGIVVVALAVLPAVFVLGRQTAPHPAARAVLKAVPKAVPSSPDRYAEGMAVGRAAGRAEGRVLQAGAPLPTADRKNAQAQFQAGYKAGAEDVFDGYDGGWAIGRPYLIVLSQGVDGLTYRISHREEYVRTAGR